MGDKKYFWLKLKRDFFKRHDIQILEGMPNGKEIILFYLKLLCESVDHDGCLRFSDKVPYTSQMLATITNTKEEVAEKAIKTLCEFQMMEILDDGTILMTETKNMIGSETFWAEKKRNQRQSEDNVQTMSNDVQQQSTSCPKCPSKSKRKSIEKEKKNIYGANNNVLLTDEEFEKLKNKFPDYQTRIDDLSFYLSSKGAKYESHYMTILSWARKESKQTKVVTKNQFTNMTKSDIDFDDLERKLVKN